jgi:hypothetical protein
MIAADSRARNELQGLRVNALQPSGNDLYFAHTGWPESTLTGHLRKATADGWGVDRKLTDAAPL